MHTKLLKKCLPAVAISLGLINSALADVVTLDIQASGASFGNQAMASGLITFDTALLPTISAQPAMASLSPAVSNLRITITGAAEGGNGSFGLADFDSIYFWAPSMLDLSRQLIGQSLANGCIYGTSTGLCGDGAAGDFNLFAANSLAPDGTYYFQLTAATGENLRITSLAPQGVVPEPATVALFGLGMLGVAASRRKAAHR